MLMNLLQYLDQFYYKNKNTTINIVNYITFKNNYFKKLCDNIQVIIFKYLMSERNG